ncbi:MAG: hypothetical protein ABH835_01925 [Patescibacteria group bacterium]
MPRKKTSNKKTTCSKITVGKQINHKKSKEKIEQGLRGIYQNEKGEKVDMTKIDRTKVKKKGWYAWAIIGILLILSAIAVTGYFVVGEKLGKKGSDKAEIEILVPDKVSSGDVVEVEIKYNNKETVSIGKGRISIHYPDGFYFRESSVDPVEGMENAWDLENIPAGEEGSIKVKGQIVGEEGDTKSFSALFVYTPSNFQSEFQSSASANTIITDSVISVEVDVPQQVRTGEQFEYKVKFKNTSEYVLPNAKVVVNYPDNFTVNSAEPSATSNNNIWLFDEIGEESEEEIIIKGVLNSKAGTSEEFKFQFGLVEPNGEFNPQVEKINYVLVTNPSVSLELLAPEAATPGQEIAYKIKVKNTSDVDIEDLEIELEFSGKATKEASATLEKIDLRAGEEETLEYENTVKKTLDENTKEIIATAMVASAKVAGKVADLDIKTEAKTTISGGMQFEAEGRYFKDDLTKIGSGSLPPKVGKKTTYVIFWYLQADGVDFDNVKITASLPDDVKFEGEESSGISYNSSNHRVSYDADKVFADDGQMKLQFSVSVTPTENDINKLLILQDKGILEAIDSNTGQTITLESDNITTDLENDKGAKGKGVVEA